MLVLRGISPACVREHVEPQGEKIWETVQQSCPLSWGEEGGRRPGLTGLHRAELTCLLCFLSAHAFSITVSYPSPKHFHPSVGISQNTGTTGLEESTCGLETANLVCCSCKLKVCVLRVPKTSGNVRDTRMHQDEREMFPFGDNSILDRKPEI